MLEKMVKNQIVKVKFTPQTSYPKFISYGVDCVKINIFYLIRYQNGYCITYSISFVMNPLKVDNSDIHDPTGDKFITT